MTITQTRRSWAQGAADGFHGRPARTDVDDGLGYWSGRIEGAAWKASGRDFAEMMQRERLPVAVPDADQSPGDNHPGERR